MAFLQTRTWSQTVQRMRPAGEPSCDQLTQGSGTDTVRLSGRRVVVVPLRRGRPLPGATPLSVALAGSHQRVGSLTTTVAGECLPTFVFPSSWSKVTETGGAVTASQPTTGCGAVRLRGRAPLLVVRGNRLRLAWNGQGEAPDFDCPYSDGSQDVPEGRALPDGRYLDLGATITLPRILRARVPVSRSAASSDSASETCASLLSGCGPGTTYTAGATVEATMMVTFRRLGRTREGRARTRTGG